MLNYQFGKKALLDAIKNNLKINQVFLINTNYELIEICKKNKINYCEISKNWFEKFDNNLNHQFIAFEIKKTINKITNLNDFIKLTKINNNVKIVILDEIEDSRNFGAILRSCAAFEVDAIIYKKNHQAPLNELAIKTSMGATNYLNLIEVVNLTNTIKTLQDNGFWIYGTLLEKDSKSLYETTFENKCAIIFGNENKGISNLVKKNIDFKIYISMSNNIQSLNVSVAAGICLSWMYKNIE